MKVLDLFCGLGGWSVPFIEDGDSVIGIDIVDVGYRGHLILQDVRTLDGHRFRDFDLIIGSPPCEEFSIAKECQILKNKKPRDIEGGLELIHHFERIVAEANPKFWAMENVENLKKWYPEPPIWKFKISKGGRRLLWGNFGIPLSPEFLFKRKIRNIFGWDNKTRAERSKIPYPIARFVADSVKEAMR